MRLTADIIAGAPQFINPLREREIDLRACKVTVIENLGTTDDQFDVMDLSDNLIVKLDGFPQLKRLRTLVLNNNKITRIAPHLQTQLPILEDLILTGNNLKNLADLEPLGTLKTLKRLSLVGNDVTKHTHYRLFVIHTLPSVTMLDFRRVRPHERAEAKRLFGSSSGKDSVLLVSAQADAADGVAAPVVPAGPSAEDLAKIRNAIASAKTLEEVQRLELLLQSGAVPTGPVPMQV